MKERWAMRRSVTLMPGDVIWLGIEFTLTTVKPRMRIHIQGKTEDGRGTIEAELPRDLYVAVRKKSADLPVSEDSPRNLRPGRTVLGAPPVAPTPPPLRYERGRHAFGSWLDNLGDWLNGR